MDAVGRCPLPANAKKATKLPAVSGVLPGNDQKHSLYNKGTDSAFWGQDRRTSGFLSKELASEHPTKS